MKRFLKKENLFLWSILSLSLLTVMAGAAVAPALDVIQSYFSDTNPLYVQLIISIPAIFIVLTSLVFGKLCKHIKTKTLVLIGLFFYTFGGILAGVFNSIWLVLVARSLVGIGVGIIMPLSTGLLGYYFPSDWQEKLMGYSSAMNQMGGVIATLFAGILAGISWRASFLVYLLGLIGIVLCCIFLPNERIVPEDKEIKEKKDFWYTFRKNYWSIIAMFLLMVTFFVYPTNFAMQESGILPQEKITIFMALMDFSAFFGGLLFVNIKKVFHNQTKIIAPLLFLFGYGLLLLSHNEVSILIGSLCIGFANGIGIPFIISDVSIKLGKLAVTTVMPLLSAALYLAQFACPFLISGLTYLIPDTDKLAYRFASGIAFIFVIWSMFFFKYTKSKIVLNKTEE